MNALDQTTNAFAAAGTNDIRAIKPPVPVDIGLVSLWWILAALVVAAALAGLLWSIKRKNASPLTPEPAHARARRKLMAALALLDRPRLFCIAVSDTLRVYLEERFNFRAPERTTEEFMNELQATPLLNAEQRRSLGVFLGQCDLVKFAKHEPARSELEELHAAALRLVTETEPPPPTAAPPVFVPPTLDRTS
ncbi:MAG: hypothetical protein EXS19_03475 [Pedosphaera sp.]|nr:hypothetical protein [Pedosphaera sp.]